jgi:protein ImuB
MNPLWLALHLPYLPLEAVGPLSSPSAVVEQGRIFMGDEAARQVGIDSGVGVSAARMLAPAITLIPRNKAQEATALHTLACWAGSLTPRVSLTPDTLLLEIGSCLNLFGGLEAIVAIAREGIQAQGFTVAIVAAPTSTGALWLAQTGTDALCLDRNIMRQYLEALPIAVLPHKAAVSLHRFGATTLADARKLPSAALTRRIGVDAIHAIARAFGDMPDPRLDFVFPETFSISLELPSSVETAAGLLFAARRLTAALAGWLSARQAGVREMVLQLQHRQDTTDVVLRFADLTSDERRFERVLREQLERMTLSGPVESLRLEATLVALKAPRSHALFDDAQDTQDAIGALLERLSARLGEKQVYRVASRADHRPECATQHVNLFDKTKPGKQTALPRPLWLLYKPEALTEVHGHPYRGGPLKLLAGPERIESGWWDSGDVTHDVRRDYFIAHSVDTRWLWIYRECNVSGGWFLQGYFA